MNYDRIIQDALRLARAPRKFALGGGTDRPINHEENFRNWFGNSKAVDKEGKPWVHYHVTSRHFSEFIPGGHDPSLSGPAIWLTPHKHNQPAAHNVMRRGEFREGANVMPLYVKIENPLYVTNSNKEEKAELKKKFGSKSPDWPMTLHPEDVKKIKDAGYDGIFHINDYSDVKFNPETGEGLETIVFDPSQLKSAIGNSGEFNPKSNDITKSYGGMAGPASGGDVDQPRKLDDMGFYSSAAESARSLPQSKGTPQQMLATMKGVKPAELEWSGVQDKFAGQKSVTKDDLAQHFEQNVPEIKETVLGGKKEKNNTPTRQEVRNEFEAKLLHYNDIDEKYNSMIEDGKGHLLTEKDHEEYQHALSEMDRLTMELHERLEEIEGNEEDDTKYSEYTVGSRYGNTRPSQRNYREVLLHLPGEKKFQSVHWDPANVVTHLRMQDRGPDNNILHLEELQSDWAQKGRDEGFSDFQDKINYETKLKDLANRAFEEAYQNAINKTFSRDFAEKFANKIRDTFLHHNAVAMFPEEADSLNKLYEKYKNYFSGVPKSPYVTNTDHWVELGLKRALLEAARGGYDKLVWTPGEEQAKRFDLSKQVNKITYHPLDKAFNAYDKSGRNVIYENDVEPHDIKKYIGNELAERLLEKSNYSKSLLDEYEVLRHPDSNKWGLYLYGEPSHDYGGEILEFDSKSDAREHLNDKLREEIDRHLPSLEGLDLKVGGEGMKSFYDKILPSALRRVLKPHTDKIQPTSHVVKGNDGEDVTLPGIEITPELRESILKKGFSYYARGGEVRQHFEDGGGAEGGSPAGDTGGFMGDTTGMDTAPAPSNVGYSAEDENAPPPNVTQQNPYSHFEGVPVLESVEKSITTGPGLVGAIAPQPFGALAAIAESINNAYYDGKARADIDPNAGGAGTSEQPQFQQTPIYDVQQNPVVSKALDVTAPKGQFTINESLTKPSIVEAPVAAPAPAPAPEPAPAPAPAPAPVPAPEPQFFAPAPAPAPVPAPVPEPQFFALTPAPAPAPAPAPEPQFFAPTPAPTPAPAPTPTPAPAPAPTPQPFPTAAPELEEPAPILPEPQPTPALATVPPVVYHSDRDDIGSGLPFPKADEEDPQKLIQAFSIGKPKLPPMMAEGGAVPMASGGETGDTQSMPQLTSEQQSLLDQLSRAIDRVYPAMDAAEARQPVIRHEPTMPGEPALTTEQHQEYNIGQLQNALARVPTDYPTGPVGYAEGGDVGDNPAVQKALALTSGVPAKKAEVPPFSIQSLQAPDPTAKFKGYKFASLDEGEATTQKLAEIVKNAIDRHISLPPNERVQNSLKAIRALEPYLGKRKDGSPIAIIGKNSKLEKSMKGYKGGEPITLPDGRGIETTGISMFPAYKEENFSLCPNSASCEKQCLGKYSGNFYALGGGQDPDAIKGPRRRAYNRTIAFLREPEAFAIRAFDDIDIAKRQAAQYGNHLGVRMNVLSDIHPEVYRPIMENHPDVSFYDYTKMAYRRILPNHHLTYSSTGLTQDDVQNPWTNWGRMRRVLDRGDNVAMVFTNKQRVLPSYVHDTETGKRYKVIDGRTHDFRPLDSLSAEPGTAGMIVGLSNLKAFGSREKAHRDSKGFFVKYDPQKDGDSVKVIPQGKGMTGMNNDGKVEKEP